MLHTMHHLSHMKYRNSQFLLSGIKTSRESQNATQRTSHRLSRRKNVPSKRLFKKKNTVSIKHVAHNASFITYEIQKFSIFVKWNKKIKITTC